MSEYRILGKEVTVRITSGGVLQTEITAIKDMTWKPVIKLITEGYLGEIAQRHREIFDEIMGSFNVVPEGNQAFKLQKAVYDRARTASANPIQINVGFRLQFPSGTVVRITNPDVKLEQVGDLNFSGRDAFGNMAFAYKGSSYIPSF